MTGTYNFNLVAISVLIAIFASYVALNLAGRVSHTEGLRSKFWLYGGAFSMGIGIWSMHFTGMLAFNLPISMAYDVLITVISALIAIVVSGFALFMVSRVNLGTRNLLLGGVLMGAGICAMHYTGMAAMRMLPPISYDPALFAASLLIAIVASVAALWLAFKLRDEGGWSGSLRHTGAAVIMGVAISGMHYTGMAAARFAPDSICLAITRFDSAHLQMTIGFVTFIILGITLLLSVFDARLAERSEAYVTSLSKINEELKAEINQRLIAEKSLRESEEQLRSILDTMFVFVGLMTLDGQIVEVNQASLEAAGLKREDVLGRTVVETYWLSHSPATQEQVRQALSRTAQGEIVREDYSIRIAGGRNITIDTTFAPLRDASGQITHVVCSAVDITERKRAEIVREQAEERFRQLAENIREVFWLYDPVNHSILYVSPAYETIWGRSVTSLYADPNWFDAVHLDDRDRVQKADTSKQISGTYNVEYRIIRPDGNIRWIHDQAFPVRNDAGEIYRFAGVAEDITARKKTEEQLTQSQKMEAVGQLTGGIAHDFNNRLTVIIGNLELLQRRLGKEDLVVENQLKSILSAAEGASDLTRQLLTFSRQQVLEPTVIDINTLITGMRDMLQRTLGETINVVISPGTDLWPVRTDRHLLVNVLINLAVNARDAMPKGGQLTFETYNVRLDETFVETHAYVKPGDYVLLSVSDTGLGMSEEIKQHIFEPFFTTKEEGKGTGLGLAMVYGFVKQSGGHIEIYSEPGHGTSFKLYFPKDVSTAVVDTPSTPATAGEEGAVIRDKTILLVEDEATVRNIVVTLLGNLGCRVLSADSGPAALEIFAKTPDIDLLFTDMIMPGGMTGLELAAKIRERMPELKVLYTSGYAPQAAADRRTIEHPNDFWLAKPYRFKTLKDIIIKALH